MLTRNDISECQLVASQDYTAVIAAALNTEAAYLLNWHKVGRQVTASVPDGVTSEDDLDQKLQVPAFEFSYMIYTKVYYQEIDICNL